MDATDPTGLALSAKGGVPAAPSASPRRRALVRTLLEAAGALALSGTVAFVILRFHGTLGRLGPWNYLGAFLIELADAATILIPTPGHAYVFAMAASMSPLLLGLVGGAGAALGELSGYFVGASGRHVIEEGRRYERFQALTRRWGGAVLFLFASLPVPFDVAGLWAGGARYPLWRFLLAVTPGKVLKVTGIALAGDASGPWLVRVLGWGP